MDWDNIWVCMPPKSSREGQPGFAKGSHCGIYNRDKLLHLLPLEKQNIGMGREANNEGPGKEASARRVISLPQMLDKSKEAESLLDDIQKGPSDYLGEKSLPILFQGCGKRSLDSILALTLAGWNGNGVGTIVYVDQQRLLRGAESQK
ncbi:hypothetical protein PRBEI_2000794100 [Prionailurus iriomotensis]